MRILSLGARSTPRGRNWGFAKVMATNHFTIVRVLIAGFVFATALAAAAYSIMPPSAITPALAQQQQKVAPPSREAALFSYAPIVKKAAPAVVNAIERQHMQLR